MMNNLFSIFDPSTSTMSMAWTSLLIPIILLISTKMKKLTKSMTWTQSMLIPLSKEINSLMKPNLSKGTNKIMMMTFLSMFTMNFVALSPFTFTPTAHMMIALPTALSMWMAMMIFGWANHSKNMLIHTVPMGTPIALMNFMVLIELTSNIIRPITLSIRLSANMVAGHLLLSLLGNFAMNSTNNLILSSSVLIILTLLEMAVALIQAYVFMTLLTLYTTEIH